MEYDDNRQRTADYFKKFDREKTLKSLIRDIAPVVFDVGSNTGQSLDEFKRWWPAAFVHCFEPQRECFAELQKRAEAYDRVAAQCCAVGAMASDGEDFYTQGINSGLAGFHKVNLESCDSIHLQKLLDAGSEAELLAYRDSINRKRQVRVLRLDEYMRESGVTEIDLLKIDTQGFEPEVLSSLADRLGDVKVVLTELMFYDYYERKLSFSDIERYLLPAGFSVFDINYISKNPMNGRTDWVDIIYVNDRKKTGESRV